MMRVWASSCRVLRNCSTVREQYLWECLLAYSRFERWMVHRYHILGASSFELFLRGHCNAGRWIPVLGELCFSRRAVTCTNRKEGRKMMTICLGEGICKKELMLLEAVSASMEYAGSLCQFFVTLQRISTRQPAYLFVPSMDMDSI